MIDDNMTGDPETRDVPSLPENETKKLEEDRLKRLKDEGIDESAVLGEALKNIGIWDSYFMENKTRGQEDSEFLFRNQWRDDELADFKRLFKPALTFNKLRDTYRKIVGEQRKNTPQLKVRSTTGNASQEAIDLRTNLVKTISYQSRNDIIYQTAFESALAKGQGAFLITTDYEDYKSFKQIIKYERINDVNQCGWDPCAIESTKDDGNFCWRRQTLTKQEFEATYPNIQYPTSFPDPTYVVDFEWETEETITVCDYWVKEWYPVMVYELSNGEGVEKDDYDDLVKLHKKATAHVSGANKALVEQLIPPIPEILNERQSQSYKIRHYRLIMDKIIDWSDWPSKYLPLIYVDGDSYWLQGKQYTRSLINDAKDAQRFLNYLASEIAGQIKNLTRGQYVGTPQQVVGNEDMWKNPERQAGILLANPDPKVMGGLPRKDPPSEIPQTLLMQYQRATSDIKEIVGFFDEQAGTSKNDLSGEAVKNLQLRGASGAFIFFDNLNRAIAQGGRVVLDLLPKVYDSERKIVINSIDGTPKNIILNHKQPDGSVENELEEGDYDIEIDTAPSFAIQKEQAIAIFMQLVSTSPQVFPLVADLIAKNLDLQNTQQVVDRLKLLVPPEIIAKEEGKEPPPPKPDPQQQMMQMQMQLAEAKLEEQKAEIEVKQQKNLLEQKRHRLAELQMMLDAKEMNDKMLSGQQKDATEIHKAELNYAASMSRLLHDIGVDLNKHELEKSKLKHQPKAKAEQRA